MTAADDLAAVWDEVRPIFAENFHADTYEVIRTTQVPDGYGGTTQTEVVVEGPLRCRLDIGGQQGGEAITGSVPVGMASYSAELPIDSVVSESDTLRINGRTFEVVAKPKRGGNHDLFTEVELEERST